MFTTLKNKLHQYQSLRNRKQRIKQETTKDFTKTMHWTWTYHQRIHFCKKLGQEYYYYFHHLDDAMDLADFQIQTLKSLQKFDKLYFGSAFSIKHHSLTQCIDDLSMYKHFDTIDTFLDTIFGISDYMSDYNNSDFVSNPSMIPSDINIFIQQCDDVNNQEETATNLNVSNIQPTNSKFYINKGMVQATNMHDLRVQAVKQGGNALVNVRHSTTPSSALWLGNNVYTGTAIFLKHKKE